jgi:cytochrome c oxidase subunit 4
MADSARKAKHLLWVWIALLLLLGISTASAYISLGKFNLIISLTISAIKTALVAAIFMRLNGSHNLFRTAACLGLLMLIILFALSGSDFLTTTIYRAPWQSPAQIETN